MSARTPLEVCNLFIKLARECLSPPLTPLLPAKKKNTDKDKHSKNSCKEQ
ncbi:hypothetical protein E1A91_A11G255100v1 [Gossypium mustelinum]|uniref:Uncharacterized protein n=1 Tax=Gossypium mustelinum TaxID=34275 RepID=A0A5D2XAP6_GOSMU|nr:hypothetical protein E1A91_A11G255100v1 [Gossypium mustelinum]